MDKRMTIFLRIKRAIVCNDGIPSIEEIHQVKVNGSEYHALTPGMTIDRARQEFGPVAKIVVEETVTVRRHSHIGEYGSPKIHRCTALDRIR